MTQTLLSFLPMLGAAGVIVLAQLQVKEHSEQAALALTIGGGLEAAYLLARYFLTSEYLWAAGPLVQVGAAGAVAFGLITLVDELNPKQPSPLPATLENHQQAGPNIPLRVMFGVFGSMAVLASAMRMGPVLSISGLLAIAGALVGSVWVEKQGPLGRWVLQRRPDLVVWSYVHQLRVVNRKTGSSTTHWSAQLGLASGTLVPIPALTEQHAQSLVAAVMERCPGIALGFSAENSTRFKSSPPAMRAGGRV